MIVTKSRLKKAGHRVDMFWEKKQKKLGVGGKWEIKKKKKKEKSKQASKTKQNKTQLNWNQLKST